MLYREPVQYTRPTVVLVAPKTCIKCKGSGYVPTHVHHLGIAGLCTRCDGRGKVEGDRATIRAAKAAADAERAALALYIERKEAFRVAMGTAEKEATGHRIYTRVAVRDLPKDRLDKAMASWEAGYDPQALALHLVAWARDGVYPDGTKREVRLG